ncbi:MAG: hypothetical protein KKD17_03460 [Nanoarchaeota archaeon]|nr:hypothetical protein [Nanoarchaeota archaeon]
MAMEKRVFVFIIFILTLLLLVPAAIAAEEHKYYIAGAYINQDSAAFLNILNPGDTSADAQVRIFYEKNDSGGFKLTVPAHSTSNTDLSKHLDSNFGLEITSGSPLAVDSVQYDTTYSGGFGTLAALKPDYVWHFAEGYSSGMVKTYLYILNPGAREANIGVTLYYDSGEKKTFNLNVPAQKHLRVDLKDKTMPEKRFGMKVTSTVPIVASAGNFNKKFSGGSGGTGTSLLAKRWMFPDGYTSTEATEFINILNPSLGVAHLKVTLQYDDGTTRSFDETVPAQSKKMILLNNFAQEMKWFSTIVDSDVNIAVENTHYDSSYSAGHGGIGATSGATEQYFANSVAGDKSKSYLAVYNPSDKEALLDITFYYLDGTVKQLQESAPALMRSTIDLNKRAVIGMQFGMQIKSTEPVVARQVTYNQKQSSGYSQFGAVIPAKEKAEVVEETLPEEEAPEARAEGYTLQKEEVVAPSRFKEKIAAGMSSAAKYTYDKDGQTVVAWMLRYSDTKAVSKALSAALGGEMFTLLEVRPDYVRGLPAHSFIAEKSEGYMWTGGNDLYVTVAADAEDAYGLAELFASGNAPLTKERTGLGTIIVVLAALIALIFFVRWVFRRTPEEAAEEKSAWEDVIPSAKPKTKKPAKKESAPKKAVPAKKEKPVNKSEAPQKKHEPKKEEHRPEKRHEEKLAKKEEHKPEKRHEDKPAKEERKQEHKKEESLKKPAERVKNISIREIPREKMTAQDLLDQMEEIPEYEDVFRHVNRDQEEIKQK